MAQGGQEALVGLEVPSLQACPQFQPGQDSLEGPVDLQGNKGVGGCAGRREARGGRHRTKRPGGLRGEGSGGHRPERTLALTSLVLYWAEHRPPLGVQDKGHLVLSRCLETVSRMLSSPFQALRELFPLSVLCAWPVRCFRSSFRLPLRRQSH